MSSQTELYNNIQKIKNTVEENKKEERYRYLINKYGNLYTKKNRIKKKDTTEEKIERQYELLVALHEKKVNRDLVDRYLDLMVSQLDHQYSSKTDIENKTGFVIAFVGVLLSAILSEKGTIILLFTNILDNELEVYTRFINMFFLVLIFSGLVVALISATFALIHKGYARYVFSDKALNYNCLVDDTQMMYVKLIDSITNSIINNGDMNKRKHIAMKISVISTLCLVVIIIIANIYLLI